MKTCKAILDSFGTTCFNSPIEIGLCLYHLKNPPEYLKLMIDGKPHIISKKVADEIITLRIALAALSYEEE